MYSFYIDRRYAKFLTCKNIDNLKKVFKISTFTLGLEIVNMKLRNLCFQELIIMQTKLYAH